VEEPVVVIRGKVLVGKADRVNANAPAVKGQSDEDAREKELHGVGRTESTKGPGTSTMQSTFRLGGDRVRSSLEAPTSDQRKVHDSPEKGKWTIGDAQKSASLRSGAELQGAQTATLDSDKSARKVDDRVVTGGFLRPMATDGKGEEDSPRTNTQNKSRMNTQNLSRMNTPNSSRTNTQNLRRMNTQYSSRIYTQNLSRMNTQNNFPWLKKLFLKKNYSGM
jgi:hypothetical protein